MLKRLYRGKPPEDDALLLDQYRERKDLRILGRLYTRYTDLVYGLCLRYLKSEEEASDAVMEIFEVLAEKAARHEVREFKSWLYTLAKNHCLMILRKAARQPVQTFDPELMYALPFSHLSEEEDQAHKEQLLQKLEQCLETLPEQQRLCVRLFYLDEISYKEIAGRQGMDLGQVRSHIQNGRRNLRNCMEV